MNMSTQRRVSMITLAAVILLLPGCSSLTPANTEPTSTPLADASAPAEEASPTPTPDSRVAAPPTDLSYDAGADLDPAVWRVAWGDPFQTDAGFTVLSPDNGNGSWSYVDSANQCHLFFYQGAVTDLDMSHDDRTITDDYLSIMLSARMEGVTREDVSKHAVDDMVWQADESGTVSVRTIWGSASDESSWLDSARMFGAQGGGVYVSLSCPPGQDVTEEHNKIWDDYLSIGVLPL